MSDFKTILVKDSVIGDITSDLDFAVKSGASQTTFQPFPSTSTSNSALIWNVQVPSENVVIGRDVLLNTALVVELSYGGGVPLGNSVWSYGNTDSFQAFPLNSLFTTATAQINNTTVSINSKDVLPSLLRMNNSRELYRYNSMTPALPDQAYGYYGDGVNASNNPLASYNTASYDLDQVPRGAFPIIYKVARFVAGAYQDNSPISTGVANETWKIGVATIVTEPLFLSPFIWANPEYNCQGLLGINNMAFTMNIDATASRVWSTASPYFTGIVLGSPTQQCFNQSGAFLLPSTPAGQTSLISNTLGVPSLLFKFLSTQPSDLIQTKNVVPYMDFPRYLTSSANNPTFTTVGQSGVRVNSSNLQINQIPDYFIITARIPMSQQTPQLSMSQFVIQNISINLNNQSGLLSSASQYDLWRASSKNGSVQSWAEFSGLQSSFTNGVSQNIATTGSVLVLSPPYDLSLPNYISSGSLGNYNFQFSVTLACQYPQEIFDIFNDSIPIELCVVCVNSGIFSTQQGVSAVYTGILTKEMVLSSVNGQQASAMTSQETSRMIGGQMLNGALTAIRGMRKHHKGGAMGMATSGGAMGTASSGGARGMSKYC
jgi:hypothetical protein